MFNTVLDGAFVFDHYKGSIVLFFVVVMGFGTWVVDQFNKDEKNASIRLAFAFGLGTVAFSFFAFLLVILGFVWPALYKPACFLLLGLAVILLIKAVWPHKQEFHPWILSLTALSLLFYLILRLAYLRTLVLPPYSDSLIHYQIIAGFLDPTVGQGFNLSLKNIFVNYYHFGFHSMAAWMVSVTNISIGDSISLFGVLFLSIAPISTGLLAYALTRNTTTAFFSSLLTAVGWSMPAFSMNWGKVPALGAIAVVPAVLAAILYYRGDAAKKTSNIFIMILLVGGLALLHSRALIFLALGAIVVFSVGKFKLDEKTFFFQAIRFTILFLVSLLPAFEWWSGFYKGIWLLIPAFIFAFYGSPRLSIGVFLFNFGLWVITVSSLAVFGEGRSLLDRQFYQMSMYLPLSLIGGAGLYGITRHVAIVKGENAGSIASVILAVGFLANFFMNGSFYPDRCCNYFTRDDQTAFQWIEKNTPSDSLFLISTFQNQGRTTGTDAGLWLEILANRPANKIPFNIVWDSPSGINSICSSHKKAVYIYSGGNEFSFTDMALKDIQRFQPVFRSGKTVIYQALGCEG